MNQLAEIESNIEFRDSINPDISSADIAWHLDHMLKAINSIFIALGNQIRISLNLTSTLKELFSLNQNQYFSHYIFGILNRDKTLRFIEIHTNHHLKIVRDILDH